VPRIARFIGLLLLCAACTPAAPPVVIYVTATPEPVTLAPTEPPTELPTETAEATVTFRLLPTSTPGAPTAAPPSLTPSFTPEPSESPVPKGTAGKVAACRMTLAPNGFTTLYQNDKTLQAALGCPQSAVVAVDSVTLPFENGFMIWSFSLADQQRKVIYALFNNGTYLRTDDTWSSVADPADTGEVAPAGKKAPTRGFGKLWKLNAAVRGGLGWALTDEAATRAQIQRFERGELLYVASTDQIYIFTGGRWRVSGTKF